MLLSSGYCGYHSYIICGRYAVSDPSQGMTILTALLSEIPGCCTPQKLFTSRHRAAESYALMPPDHLSWHHFGDGG